MPFCKHRWTNIKQWITDGVLYVIQRCRWCNKWQRVETPMNDLTAGKIVHYKMEIIQTSTGSSFSSSSTSSSSNSSSSDGTAQISIDNVKSHDDDESANSQISDETTS